MKNTKFLGFFRKKSTLLTAVCLMTVGLLAGCGSNEQKVADSTQGKAKVGIVQLVEHPALDASNRGFIDGLAKGGFHEGDNLVILQQNAQGDQSNLNTIAKQFVTEKVDLIGAIATPAAQTVANQTKTIPIVAMAITDFKTAKLVKSDDEPGTNVTGVIDLPPIGKSVELIKASLPNAKRVGTVYNPSEVNSEYTINEFTNIANQEGLEVVPVTITSVNEAQQVAASLVQKKVDAVFFPLDNIVTSSWPILIKILAENNIPVFPTDAGAKQYDAVAMYSVDFYDLGVQAGEMAAQILKGEAKPQTMPIGRENYKLYVNEDVAKRLGVNIPEHLLKDAVK